MITSVDAAKAFTRVQHPFVNKICKVGREDTDLNPAKATCGRPTANVVLGGEKLGDGRVPALSTRALQQSDRRKTQKSSQSEREK